MDTEPAASPSPSPSPPEAPTPSWFAVGLADAETAYDAGEFERAQDRVLKLIERVERVPSLTDRARLWRLAAFVHVAFDRRDDACTAFRAWRAQGTPTALDPVRVSPKIRAALSACPADDPS